MLVAAQVLGTSVWFAPQATDDLAELAGSSGKAPLILATQAGFVAGTMIFALSGLADRFAASRVFALSAAMASASTAALLLASQPWHAGCLRFLTGISLAGVYPLGMKLVVSWFPDKAPQALGWLVGALVLGTASPWLLRAVTGSGGRAGAIIPWASTAALLAGLAVLVRGDGPHLKRSAGISWRGLAGAWASRQYRSALGGYLGHMVELYAFWALVPTLAARAGFSSPWAVFGVVAMGAAGCVLGGHLARWTSPLAVARFSMACSAACGLAWPWASEWPPWPAMALLALWGSTVVADSPQFSALASAACPRDGVAAATALMVSLGFAVTIPAIEAMAALESTRGPWVGWALAAGPIAGLALMGTGACERGKRPPNAIDNRVFLNSNNLNSSKASNNQRQL
ncbi:MAG: MFS transporter [Planctomycetes bacterium]|nr:MFS transporter [Planctomycetota bacterium]